MNERIKELVLQSQLVYETTDGKVYNSWEDYVDLTEYVEKFAELIIKECAKVIKNGGYWSGGPVGPKRQCTPPEIAEMVKDVFGVKE